MHCAKCPKNSEPIVSFTVCQQHDGLFLLSITSIRRLSFKWHSKPFWHFLYKLALQCNTYVTILPCMIKHEYIKQCWFGLLKWNAFHFLWTERAVRVNVRRSPSFRLMPPLTCCVQGIPSHEEKCCLMFFVFFNLSLDVVASHSRCYAAVAYTWS